MAFSVAARIRGPPTRSQSIVAKDDRSLVLSNGDVGSAPQLFTLDRVFGASVSQRELFASLSPDLLKDFLEGVNVGMIAHGAACSGKSYSILGDARTPESLDGLAVRVLEAVLSHCSQHSSYSFRLQLSFVAVHDKYALDLLAEHQRPLVGVAKVGRGYEVEGLTKHLLTSRSSFIELVQRGCRALVGPCPHLILTFHLTRTRRDQVVTSAWRFVDLIAAEFPLDRSLALLGTCLRKLTDPSTAGQTSFRECLLTQLIKDSLRGRFCLLACVDPSQYLSSFHTLSFVSNCLNLDKATSQHSFRYYRWLISRTAGGRAFVQVAFVQFLGALGQAVVPVGVSSPHRSHDAPLANGPEHVTRASGSPWIDYDSKPELIFDFGSSVSLQGYEFFVSPEAPDGEPVAWEFQASNDLKEWFVLDKQERPARRRSSVGSFLKPRAPINVTREQFTPPPSHVHISRAPQDGGGNYQWYRWTITSVRPQTSPPSLQASKVCFYKGNIKLGPVSVAEQELSAQPPSALLDTQLMTKWVKFADSASLVFDFGAGVALSAFEWFTAPDMQHSDPATWLMEGSTDLTTWQLLAEYPPAMPRSTSSGLFSLDKKMAQLREPQSSSVRSDEDARELARLQSVHKALVETAEQATQAAQNATRLQKQALSDSESAGAALQAALQTNIQLQRKAQAAQEHNQQLLALNESQQQRLTEQEAKLASQLQTEAAALKPITELCQLIVQFADPFMAGVDRDRSPLSGSVRSGRRRSHGALAPLPADATPLQSLSHVHVFLCALKEDWEQLIQQRDSLEQALKAKTEEAAISKNNYEQSSAELAGVRREWKAEVDRARADREQLNRIAADKAQLETALQQEGQKAANLQTKLSQIEGTEKQLDTWRAKCEELQASLVPILAQRVQLEQAMTDEQTRATHERHEAQQQQARLQAQVEVLQAQLARNALHKDSRYGGADGGEVEEAQSSEAGVRGVAPSTDHLLLAQQLNELRQHNERLEATQLQATKDIAELKAELENQQLRHAEELRERRGSAESMLPSQATLLEQQAAHLQEIQRLKSELEAQEKQLTQLRQERDDDEPLITPSSNSQLESALQNTQQELENSKAQVQQLSLQCDRHLAEIAQMQQEHEAANSLLQSKIAIFKKQQSEYEESKLGQVLDENATSQLLVQELKTERIQHKQHLEQWKAEIEGFAEQLEHQRSQHRLETDQLQREYEQQMEALKQTHGAQQSGVGDEQLIEPASGQMFSPRDVMQEVVSPKEIQEVTRMLETQHATQLERWKEQFEGLAQQLETQRELHKKQTQELQQQHQIQIDSINQRMEAKSLEIEAHASAQLEDLKSQHLEELQKSKAELTLELENLHKQQVRELQAQHQIHVESHNRQTELLNKQIETLNEQRDSLNQKIGSLNAQLQGLDSQNSSSKQEEIEQLKTTLQAQWLEQKTRFDELARQFEEHKAASQAQFQLLTQQHQEELKRAGGPHNVEQEFGNGVAVSQKEVERLKLELEVQQAQHAEQTQLWKTQLEDLIGQGIKHTQEIEHLQQQHRQQLDALKQQYEQKSKPRSRELVLENPMSASPNDESPADNGHAEDAQQTGTEHAESKHQENGTFEAQIAEYEKRGEQLLYLKQQLELILQEVAALRASELEAKTKLQERTEEVSKLTRERDELRQALQNGSHGSQVSSELLVDAKREAELEQLKQQVQEFEIQKQELEHLQEQAKELESLHQQVGAFERQMAEFEGLRIQVDEQKRQFEELEIDREKARREASDLKQKQLEFDLFEQKVKDYDKQIERLQLLQDQAEEVERKKQQLQRQLEELERRELHVSAQAKELQRHRQEHEYRKNQFEGLQDQIESFAQQSQQYYDLRRQLRELEHKFKEAETTGPKSPEHDRQKAELQLLKQQVDEEEAQRHMMQKDHASQWEVAQQRQQDEVMRVKAEASRQREEHAAQLKEMREKHEQQRNEVEFLRTQREEYDRQRLEVDMLQQRLREFLIAPQQPDSPTRREQQQQQRQQELEEKAAQELRAGKQLTQLLGGAVENLQKTFEQIQQRHAKQAQDHLQMMEELAEQLHWKQVEHEQEIEDLQVRLLQAQEDAQQNNNNNNSMNGQNHEKDYSSPRSSLFELRRNSKEDDEMKDGDIQDLQQEIEIQKEEHASHLQQWKEQFETLTHEFEQSKHQSREQIQQLQAENQRLNLELSAINAHSTTSRTQHSDHLQLTKAQSEDLEKQHRHQIEELQRQHARHIEELKLAEQKYKQISADELKRLQQENTMAEAVTIDLLRLLLPGLQVNGGKLNWSAANELVRQCASFKQASELQLAQLRALLLPSDPSVMSPSTSPDIELERLERMTRATKELQNQAALVGNCRPLQEDELLELEALHDLLVGDGKETKLASEDELKSQLSALKAERSQTQKNLTEVLAGVEGLQRAYLQQTLEIRRYFAEAEQSSRRLQELEAQLARLAAGEAAPLPLTQPAVAVEPELFHDVEFPHGEVCLGSAVHSRVNVEFRRPRDCYDRPALFDVIEPSDVRQGCLGDCWLMSSLAALAEFPELIQNIFKEKEINSNGSYTCRFYDVETKRFVEVKVDDGLPCKPGGTPTFAQSLHGELWPCLVEKAFAKWLGSYSALSGGWPALALQALTGSESLLYRFAGDEVKALSFRGLSLKKAAATGAKSYTTGQSWPADKFFEQLQRFDAEGCIMTLASAGKDLFSEAQGPSDDFGIVGGHAYSLIAVKECFGFQLCEIRNPWGDFEWGGDWSDRSDLWKQHPDVAAELKPRLNKDDGVFWMPYHDLLRAFTSVTVNKVRISKRI